MDEERGDQPLSSEELLRRAREGLGDSGTREPPADFQVESSPPPVADRTPDVVDDYVDYVEADIEPDAAVEPDAPFEPDAPVEPEPTSSDPSAWAPPPPAVPEGGAEWRAGSPGPAPTPVRRGGGGIFSKLWIPVVLIIAGLAVFSFFDDSKSVDQIAVGDCMDTPEEDEFFEIETIDCTEAHDLEVFALIDLSVISPEFSVNSSYPGDDAVYEAAINACLERFEGYVGMAYEESALYIDAFTPTFEGWTEVDDREANCLVFQVNAEATDIIKSRRSLRDSGI